MLDLSRRPHYSLAACRAYFDLLKGLCLKNWTEIGKPDGAELVGVLREKWDADLKAANGTAAKAQRKVLAQGKELTDLQAAHMRLRKNLTKVQEERDVLRTILLDAAPTAHYRWLRSKRTDTDRPVIRIQATGGMVVHPFGQKADAVVYYTSPAKVNASDCITLFSIREWPRRCLCGIYDVRLLQETTDIHKTHETHGD